MISDYSENEMIRDGAVELLKNELGWQTVYAHNLETLGENGTLGRKSYHEVILWREFKNALKRLNAWITDAQISEAAKILESYMSSSSLLRINEEKYFLIRDGIPVTANTPDGRIDTRRAIIIDFTNPENNSFLAVSEMKIHGDLYRRRADIIGFVNGLPLLFIELKRNDIDVEAAYTENYSDYLDTIPLLFHYNAFIMLSNGSEAKIGTVGSKYEFFNEWKRLSEEDTNSKVELPIMLRGICKKENFLDLYENFILFDHSSPDETVKIAARNHQYLGVNRAVQAYSEREQRKGKLGVFWHTQGSGKSYSMLFLAQKIRRKFIGSPTIVILTDREDLNKQIAGTFEACGLLGKSKGTQFMATSGADLIEKLHTNPSYIFTLIQKFNNPDVEPILAEHDILIMSDEAHRSQYGVFANNLEKLLPTASRIGFTGTPLFSNDEITARTFGGYISIYDFKRAVEDKATVPLYYENRACKMKGITNPEINDRILEAIEAADLDPDQQEKLEKNFEKEIHILTAEPRLRAIAKDFVEHYSDLWKTGKAMFVCLNKVTCVRMYNFVQEYWNDKIKALDEKIEYLSEDDKQKLNWMKETEMCVVISQEQNEISTFQKWGLEIKPHREKIEKRELDKEYKNPDSKFRIVFVCAMWLTGFDVKSLSCLYLDKPLKAHSLMQTIARANRVAEGKTNGLIIDYIGIVKALEKALTDYTRNVDGKNRLMPTVDKEELIKRICDAIDRVKSMLNDFALSQIHEAKGFIKLKLIKDAAEAVSRDQTAKRTFTTYASEIGKLMKYLNHDDVSDNIRNEADAIASILREIQKKRKHLDNTELLVEINHIINESLEMSENSDNVDFSSQIDISKIDFKLLAKEFKKVKHKNLLIKGLDDLVLASITKLMAVNVHRADYYKKYMEIIAAYNLEQDETIIEKTFMDLMKLANSLSNEEKRYIREGFSDDEELAIYDLLFSDSLNAEEIKQIKEIAKEMLTKIKTSIASMDHWADREDSRATIQVIIRNILWNKIPDSMFDKLDGYRASIYEHIYTHYRNYPTAA